MPVADKVSDPEKYIWDFLIGKIGNAAGGAEGANKVRQASDAVLLWYERPADQSEAVQAKRAGYGEKYLKKDGEG